MYNVHRGNVTLKLHPWGINGEPPEVPVKHRSCVSFLPGRAERLYESEAEMSRVITGSLIISVGKTSSVSVHLGLRGV